MSETTVPDEISAQSADVWLHVTANARLGTEEAIAFQTRVIELFSGVDGLSFSVALASDMPDTTEPKAESVTTTAERQAMYDWLNKPVEDALDANLLSVRTYNCLKREGLGTNRLVLLAGQTTLNDIRNFGTKSLSEVQSIFEDNPFKLKIPDRVASLEDAFGLSESPSQIPAWVAKIDSSDQNRSIGMIVSMSVDEIKEQLVSKRPIRQWSKDGNGLIEVPYTEAELESFTRKAASIKTQAEACAHQFDAYKAAQPK